MSGTSSRTTDTDTACLLQYDQYPHKVCVIDIYRLRTQTALDISTVCS